jgi:hypothetical protein
MIRRFSEVAPHARVPVPVLILGEGETRQPYQVYDSYCDDPGCTIGEALFEFVPVSAPEKRLHCLCSLASGRASPDVPVTKELAILIGDLFEHHLDLILRRRQIVRAAGLLEGTPNRRDVDFTYLKGFWNFCSSQDHYPLGFLANGIRWKAFNSYCANPSCPCTEVALEFYPPIAEGDAPVRSDFRIWYDTATAAVWVDEGIELTTARSKIVRCLFDELGDPRSELGLRREFVRKLAAPRSTLDKIIPRTARRVPIPSLAQSSPSTRSQLDATRMTRNAPCPCGSGRKYKNCCANSASR